MLIISEAIRVVACAGTLYTLRPELVVVLSHLAFYSGFAEKAELQQGLEKSFFRSTSLNLI